MMPGNISPPPHGPQGGPLGKSVGSVFHGLGNSSLAPKAGHKLHAGPPVHAPGAPVSLRPSGVPTAPYGHTMSTNIPGQPPPQKMPPAPGGMLF